MPLAFEVIKLAGLRGPTIHELLAAAREHHDDAGSRRPLRDRRGVGMSGTNGSPNFVKLAPSSLTFLWDECQSCFWL